jgi:hypothetical protein
VCRHPGGVRPRRTRGATRSWQGEPRTPACNSWWAGHNDLGVLKVDFGRTETKTLVDEIRDGAGVGIVVVSRERLLCRGRIPESGLHLHTQALLPLNDEDRMAIAARTAMMSMTSRSSMRLNPFSGAHRPVFQFFSHRFIGRRPLLLTAPVVGAPEERLRYQQSNKAKRSGGTRSSCLQLVPKLGAASAAYGLAVRAQEMACFPILVAVQSRVDQLDAVSGGVLPWNRQR